MEITSWKGKLDASLNSKGSSCVLAGSMLVAVDIFGSDNSIALSHLYKMKYAMQIIEHNHTNFSVLALFVSLTWARVI